MLPKFNTKIIDNDLTVSLEKLLMKRRFGD